MYPAPPPTVHSYATISVKSHVPVTLTMKSNAYSSTVAPRPQDPNWDQADCCVCSWFFGSIDDFVLDLVMTDDDQITWDLWLAIEGLYRANKQSQAIFLSHDFHSMIQGDSSIAEYCNRMNTLADALCDVGPFRTPSVS
ncbi:uncharacterized protein [Setaria viridis]|uniref:uncharacterized protein n=1 Tax=Setaria viridis TaxID=4556 RepID=UPI003B3AA0CE